MDESGRQAWSKPGSRDDLRGDIWNQSILRPLERNRSGLRPEERNTLQSSELEASEMQEESLTI